MTSLSALLNKAKNNAKPVTEPAAPVEVAAIESPAPKPPVAGLRFGAKTPVATSPEAPVPAAKPTGLKLGGAIGKAKLAAPAKASTPDVAGMDLAGLAGLDTSNFDETRSSDEPKGFQFPDEIEATTPVRDLPEDLEPTQRLFVESLDLIYESLSDPDMLGQSVRRIMEELQENPEYIKLVQDHDVATMIGAIRNVMGVTKARKAEKSTKTRAKSTSRSKASSSGDEAMAQLEAMLGGVPSD